MSVKSMLLDSLRTRIELIVELYFTYLNAKKFHHHYSSQINVESD